MHNLSQRPPQTSIPHQSQIQIIQKPKPTNPKYDRSYTKEEITLIFSYLNANSYFQNLKKQFKFIHWMSTQQKRKLLIQSYSFLAKSNLLSQIQAIQKQTVSNHDFQKIKIVVIVLYGKFIFNHKTYTIGQWAEVQSPFNSIQEQKCVCLLFQQNIFYNKLSQFNFFHFKKAFFKKYFLQKSGIDLPSRKIDEIIDYIQFHSATQKITIGKRKLGFQDPGIYIILKGDFFLFDSQQNICVSEITENYVCQESLWGSFEYYLTSKQNVCQILFCPKQLLITSLSQQKYIEMKVKLYQIFMTKKNSRKKIYLGLANIQKELKDSKQKAQKRVTSKIDIERCLQTLQKIKKAKPKWLVQQEKKQKQIKNKRKNIFIQRNDPEKEKRKYFSVKSTKNLHKSQLKDKSPQEKELFTRHFSSMKTQIQDSTAAVTPFNSTGRSNRFMNQVSNQKGFSKFSRTSFYHQGNKTSRSYYETPKKIKSQPKLPLNHNFSQEQQLDKWDVDYSMHYDRTLSWSVKKYKHLMTAVKLKQKIFPKDKAQFFNMQDAKEALSTSFFDLQRLKRLDDQEKNKRTFQKVFKQKMLIMDSTRKNPLMFR